eukprot:GHVH01007214.1.p1 GENE.GHVH01007214.1~~GHVH01007214.1.p1  ORF type:complete len:477 (+),score=65.23 GHVH01007214.1:192-1622(+)
MRFLHGILLLACCTCRVCRADDTADYSCGVFDAEDTTCFNTTECSNVFVDASSASPLSCGSVSNGTCLDDADDLDQLIGWCVPKDSSASGDITNYCSIHDSSQSCGAVSLTCHWEQQCVIFFDYCNTEDTCTVNPDCSLVDGLCVLSSNASFYITKWLSALTITLFTLGAFALPILARRFFKGCFTVVEPYLTSASCGTLISIAIIHLLSESCMYANNANMQLSDTLEISPNWITFSISLILAIMLDAMLHVDEPDVAVLPPEIRIAEEPKDNSELSSSASDEDTIEDVKRGRFVHQQKELILPTVLKYVGVMVHGIQEGIIIGFQSAELTWIMTVVMVFHKCLFTISIGQDVRSNFTKLRLTMAGLFVISTPLALIIGCYCIASVDETVYSHLNAFSSALVIKFGLETYFDLPMVVDMAWLRHKERKGSDEKKEPSWKMGLFVGHFLVIIFVTLVVFSLMIWHLTVHDHGHEEEG